MKWLKCMVMAALMTFVSSHSVTAQTKSGKLLNVMVPAPSLSHSLFQTAIEQPAAIYLPPSYADSTRRFSVVYFLPGFNCPIHEFTLWGVYQGFDLKQSLDSLIRTGASNEMIVVMPNGLNFMGGSFYTNSPVTGNWEDFTAYDLVSYIDSRYRTIPRSQSRGVTGYSMGGSGALALAMKHPELFGAIYALSPGVFAPHGLESTNMFSDTGTIARYLERQTDFDRMSACDAPVHFMAFIDNQFKANEVLECFTYAYGAAFAPDTTAKAPYISYPYRRIDGRLTLDSLKWKRFESGFGDWPQKVRTYKSNLLQLRAIAIDYGTADEYGWIPAGCVYLSALLDSAGVGHQLLSFAGGHGDRVRDRIENIMFPFFSKYLSTK